MKIKLKNTSTVKLNGKLPGQTFTVEADDAGVPVDAYWRARLDEETKFSVGAVARVATPSLVSPAEPASPDPVASPEPPAAPPAPVQKSTKGK